MKNSEMQKVEGLRARKNVREKKIVVAKHWWRDNELPQRKDERNSFFSCFFFFLFLCLEKRTGY